MIIEERDGIRAAIIEADDSFRGEAEALVLAERIFSAGCHAAIISRELVGGALSLLKPGLQQEMARRYGDRQMKAAVVGRLNPLVGGAVRAFLKQAGLEQSVYFCPDVDAAFEAFKAG